MCLSGTLPRVDYFHGGYHGRYTRFGNCLTPQEQPGSYLGGHNDDDGDDDDDDDDGIKPTTRT